MPKGFDRLQYFVPERTDDELARASIRSVTVRSQRIEPPVTFNSDESAARFYLGKILMQDARAPMRSLASPERTEHTPDVRFKSSDLVPGSQHCLVRFDQTSASIPVFGSGIVVHLDENREIVSATGDVASLGNVSPLATISPLDALRALAASLKVDESQLAKTTPPELTFFHPDAQSVWHLAYHFRNVPFEPADAVDGHGDHGLSPSPRRLDGCAGYLVDAHDGGVLFSYRSAPALDLPVELTGLDVLGRSHDFLGRQLDDGSFLLEDPLHLIKTYDLSLGDIDGAVVPVSPIAHASGDFAGTNPAAVSAHANASHVHEFYRTVLSRDSVDNKKMVLESFINCTYARGELAPLWRNAVWWRGRMWYGQDRAKDGSLQSLARFLDIIGHELTHGVTETTAGLVYQGQSGALSESFSDIFGVIIANWTPLNPDRDVATWTWTIGAGLGKGGLPLRDLSDPSVTGDPAHMKDFVTTTKDYGGVHTNSNIHNKAVHNMLVATDASGARVFRPTEVAILMYLTLEGLSSRATFADAIARLLEVARVFYARDSVMRDARIAVIRACYTAVGI